MPQPMLVMSVHVPELIAFALCQRVQVKPFIFLLLIPAHIASFKPMTRNNYTMVSFQVNFSGHFVDLKEVSAKNCSAAKEFFLRHPLRI